MSKLVNVSRALMLGATLMLSLAGCGGGGKDAGAEPPAHDSVVGTLSGRVADAQTGQPLAGVEVKVGGLRASTDASGKYSIASVPFGRNVVAQFSKPEYASNFATLDVSIDKNSVADRTLARIAVRKDVSAAAGGVVTMAGSPAQVELPAAALVNASGAAYTGTVTVEMTPIDPGASPLNMPGNFRAQGESVPIESMGALQVELRDSTGAMLNLAPGKTAAIRIPVPAGASSPPLTMPLYYFKESTGLWVREGVARLAGSAPHQYYEGTVSHFTVWNADMPMDTIYINGCVVNGSSQPRYATVSTEGLTYFGSSSVQTEANGTFRVAARRNSRVQVLARAADDVGSVTVTTGAADLTLPSCIVAGSAAPVIVQQPASVNIAPNFPGTLQVVADNAVQYTWYRNGVVLPNYGNTLHLVGAAGAAGNYHVVVTNAHGSVTSATVTVTVGAPTVAPGITAQPAGASVLAGDAAAFAVAATGEALRYQWLRNGEDMPGAEGPQLFLGAVSAADDGTLFSVRIYNSVGTVTSDSARLTVAPEPVAPSISQQPASVSAAVGQNATFAVVAAGTGPMSYQWLKNGVAIAGAVGATYRTPVLALTDNAAQFSVRVTNAKGSVTSTAAVLTVSQASSVPGLHLGFAYGAPVNDRLAYAAVPVGGGAAVPLQPAGQSSMVAMLVQGEISNGMASNFFARSLLFWKNGSLVRRDMSGTAGLPAEVSVSTATSANGCNTQNEGPDSVVAGNDAVNALRSWVVLQKPGADGQCYNDDDQYLAVRADMSATDAPLQVTRPELPIHSAQGALTGWLVRNGLLMQRVNADFTSPVTLFTLPSAEATFLPGADLGSIAMFSAGDAVYAVDLASAAPAALTRVATLAEGEVLSDVEQANEREIVVGIRGSTHIRLLRYTIASGATQAIGTHTGAVGLTIVTPTRALLRDGSGALVSFPIAGGAPTQIPAGSLFVASWFVHAGGERIWHEVNGSLESVNSDGTDRQALNGARLAGCVLKPQTPVWASRPDCDAIMAVAGGTLRSYDAQSGAARLTYGTVVVPGAQQTTGFFMNSLTAWGQAGVLTQLVATANFSQVTYVNYLIKTDQAGLTQIVMP